MRTIHRVTFDFVTFSLWQPSHLTVGGKRFVNDFQFQHVTIKIVGESLSNKPIFVLTLKIVSQVSVS